MERPILALSAGLGRIVVLGDAQCFSPRPMVLLRPGKLFAVPLFTAGLFGVDPISLRWLGMESPINRLSEG